MRIQKLLLILTLILSFSSSISATTSDYYMLELDEGLAWEYGWGGWSFMGDYGNLYQPIIYSYPWFTGWIW